MIARCALIALAMLHVAPQGVAQQQYCPTVCQATIGEVTTGTPPSILEVSFVLQWTSATSGTGTPYCQATCEPCRLVFNFSFQKWSGDYCWYLQNAAGSTTPVSTDYNRPGILTTLCDDPDYGWIKAVLTNCTTGTPIYTRQLDLLCPCTH